MTCETLLHEGYSMVQMMDVRESLKITKSIDMDLDSKVVVMEVALPLIRSERDCKIHS